MGYDTREDIGDETNSNNPNVDYELEDYSEEKILAQTPETWRFRDELYFEEDIPKKLGAYIRDTTIPVFQDLYGIYVEYYNTYNPYKKYLFNLVIDEGIEYVSK